jgi:hypothetical protein
VPALGGLLTLVLALAAAPAHAAFDFAPGVAGFSVTASEASGDPARLAGAHPHLLTTKVDFSGDQDVRDLSIELPPGLIENPSAVARCTQADFLTPRSSPFESSRSGESCPGASQIGVVGIHLNGGGTRWFGVFNLVPPAGYPSQFGFNPFGAPIVFAPHVRQANGEYGLTLTSRNISQLFGLAGFELEIWGTPWAASHDGERGNCLNEAEPSTPFGACKAEGQSHPPRAYLTLPSVCSGPLAFAAAADAWQGTPGRYLPSGEPDLADPAWRRASFLSGSGLEGCEDLASGALASALPRSELVSSPTGLTFRLETFQLGAGLLSPGIRLRPQIRKATIALPDGLTINPSVGAGLGACTPEHFAAETVASAPGAGCPNSSKIGTATVETPLVEEALKGSLFIAKPYENPFGAALAVYFVAKSTEQGLIVKVPGKLDADPRTGQLTATFDNLPQLPYTNLNVEFREGQRAPLVTPATCGTYTSQIDLDPWGGVGGPVRDASNFKLSKGITPDGACPTPGGAPFTPKASAGMLNSNAGSYSSFYLHLTRTSAEQEITSYSTVLPPGVLGKIAGIPPCSDAAIAAAKAKLGFEEAASPSCPAASEIGHTVSGFGVGPALAYAPGKFYLAGPYHGRPLSVVAIDPATVGPFDLGTIVIRSAIEIDPRTARVTIDSAASDPIPHIFAGIPLHLRDVRVYMSRPSFMRNPTSCEPFSITSILTGSKAPFTNPRDGAASATVPFQAFNCTSLGFRPAVKLSLKGGARRGDYQQLRAVVTPRPGDANIAAAAVTLPRSQFLAQNHIRDICTRSQLEADTCPARSIVGRAVAETPLLDEPLQGPVYLRSSSNPLPDLVTVLRSRGIRIVLEGRIDTFRGGIRGTFESLPDAPVTRFTMTIFGGRKRGILVNSENLCRRPQLSTARLLGHHNVGDAGRPRVAVKCGKKGKQPRKRRNAERKGRAAR